MWDYLRRSQLRMMRVFVIYDLPSVTKSNHQMYTQFHGFLIKNGFYMIQESIYCCLARNQDFAQLIVVKVGKNSPKYGDIRCFMITEKQYQNIKIFSGNKSLQEQLAIINPIVEI